MDLIVVSGSICQCSAGTTPCPLVVLPHRQDFIEGQPVATIMDHKPIVNLATFEACKLMAMNVCIPVLPSPWSPGCPRSDIKGECILHKAVHLEMLPRRNHQHHQYPAKKTANAELAWRKP